MRTPAKKWLHGLIGGIIGGAATTGSAWLAMAGAHSAGIDVPVLNWKALLVILCSGALTSAFAYLKQSPLPPEDDDFQPLLTPPNTATRAAGQTPSTAPSPDPHD